MRACHRINQLPCDANFPRCLAHRPLKHIAHAKPASDLLDIDSFAFEGETRVTCDNEQRLKARQRSDDFFHHAVGEIFLLGIAAHVLKRKPLRGSVLMKRCSSPESPIAVRAAFRRVVSAASDTLRPFQMALMRSSLLTTRSLLRIR